jgi:hypothetical protein
MSQANQYASEVHSAFDAKNCRPFVLGQDYDMDEVEQLLPKLGIGFHPGVLDSMASYAMDTIQQPVTTASIAAPLQFLQNWLPGQVEIMTAARKIDELVGIRTIGSWEDEQIVQEVVENTGSPVPYGDTTVVPLSDWNMNFVTRSVVRFELGMRVGIMEEARAARVRVASGAQKRKSCGIQLEIQRNAVGFYGYNSGNNLTYGFLNDPNLPSYITVATGAVTSSKLWSLKTFLEIQADILTALQTLRTQSLDTIEPNKTAITLAVATNCVDYLSKTSDFGISVYAWLKQFYPNVTVVSAPQLNSANGGANVFYTYSNKVNDSSSDDQSTFVQVVPAKFQVLGVQKLAKGYEEDYSNATAGVMVKRPYAVVRSTGI